MNRLWIGYTLSILWTPTPSFRKWLNKKKQKNKINIFFYSGTSLEIQLNERSF